MFLQDNIERVGLPEVVKQLRRRTSGNKSLNVCIEEMETEPLDLENLLVAIWHLKGRMAKVYQGKGEKELDDLVRLKVMSSVPESLARASRQAGETFRDRYRIADYPFEDWERDIGRLAKQRKYKSTKMVEVLEERDETYGPKADRMVNNATALERRSLVQDGVTVV